MKKGFLLPLILSALLLTGCQRDRSVYAGSDEYKPRPAPAAMDSAQQDIFGELVRIDLPKKMFVVRVENGMEQTFTFDGNTLVLGLSMQQPVMRDLVGKEGSEVVVQWQNQDEGKLANRIDVTQAVSRHKRYKQ
jgi:uncharacterized protein YcfL